MSLNEIRKLGAQRYAEDKQNYRNPYQPATPEFNEFERGWMQALKRDEGRISSPVARAAPGEFSSAEVLAAKYRDVKG